MQLYSVNEASYCVLPIVYSDRGRELREEDKGIKAPFKKAAWIIMTEISRKHFWHNLSPVFVSGVKAGTKLILLDY